MDAVWDTFDGYLRDITGSVYDNVATRFFIRVGGYDDPNPHCFRMTIEGQRAKIERCDLRFLICLPDTVFSVELEKSLVRHYQMIAGGWTYMGGGVSYAEVRLPSRQLN